MKIKVSIIVPVYNVKEYIIETINSIMDQTLKEIEIICVDDGSTDGSFEILKNLEIPNLKLIRQFNCGPGVARNVGIENACGEFIGFVDGDDLINKYMFEHMYIMAKENCCDVVICKSEAFFNEQEITLNKNESLKNFEIINNIDANKAFMLKKIEGFSCDKLFKKCIFEKIRYSENVYYEDMYTMLSAINETDKILITNNIYYKYRQRQNSITRTISDKHLQDFVIESLKCINLINEKYPSLYDELDSYKLSLYSSMLNQYIRFLNYERKEIYNKKNILCKIKPEENIFKIIFSGKYVFRFKVIYIMWRLKIYDLYLKLREKNDKRMN